MVRRSVLVCEDNELVREMLCCALRMLGFEVTWFCTANDALELPSVDLKRFDVVMTDYDMPGLKGDEFAKRMRAINVSSQIIVMSGLFCPSDEESSREIEFLAKPFSVSQVKKRLAAFDSPNSQELLSPGTHMQRPVSGLKASTTKVSFLELEA